MREGIPKKVARLGGSGRWGAWGSVSMRGEATTSPAAIPIDPCRLAPPYPCRLLLLGKAGPYLSPGSPTLFTFPLAWPHSWEVSFLTSHAFLGYSVSLSSRSLRKRFATMNPCFHISDGQRDPYGQAEDIRTPWDPPVPSFGESFFNVTLLTFINLPKKAQHPDWLSLPRGHCLIDLYRACLERKPRKKEKRERQKDACWSPSECCYN